MKTFSLKGDSRIPFETIETVVLDLMQSWGYVSKNSGGAGFEDKSKEVWKYEFLDPAGNLALHYEFHNLEGEYRGILKCNLPSEKEQEFLKLTLPALAMVEGK